LFAPKRRRRKARNGTPHPVNQKRHAQHATETEFAPVLPAFATREKAMNSCALLPTGTSAQGSDAVLNLVMTHSPRLAAMANNKPLGTELSETHAWKHRLLWRQRVRTPRTAPATTSIEGTLRERTA
jgi:hypothetical protein